MAEGRLKVLEVLRKKSLSNYSWYVKYLGVVRSGMKRKSNRGAVADI
jgi:hypothetical protein